MYRKQITIDSSKIDATLTDFPVRVNLDEDADIGAVCMSDGKDIYFLDSDGETASFEMESFSVAGDKASGDFWVKIPSISSSEDTIFYIYYGDADSSDKQNIADTWSNGFVGVWHFKEGSGTTFADSLGANDGDSLGDLSWTSNGKIGAALSAPGTGIAASVPRHADLEPTNLTLSVICKSNTDTGQSGSGWIVGKLAADTWGSYAIRHHSSGYVRYDTGKTGSGNYRSYVPETNILDIAAGWTMLTLVWTNSIQTIQPYFNTTKEDSYDTELDIGYSVSYDLTLGVPYNYEASANDNRRFDGIIDEVRLSDVVRTDAWITADYHSCFLNLITMSTQDEGPTSIICIVDTDTSSIEADYNSIYDAIYGELGATPKCVTSKDLFANNESLTILCKASTGVADTLGDGSNTNDSFGTSAECFFKIVVHEDHRHEGIWDDTKYRLIVGNDQYAAIYLRQSYSSIIGLQADNSDRNFHTTTLDAVTGLSNITFDSCIVRDSNPYEYTANHRIGFILRNVTNSKVVNCIAYGFGSGGNTNSLTAGFLSYDSSGVQPFYNCVAYDCYRGFHTDTANRIAAVNCIAMACSNACFSGTFTDSSNNISSDATAPGSNSLTTQVATDVFTDPASKDFSLLIDSPAIDAGYDLSAIFEVDITGTTRPQDDAWDIGAFEYRSSTPTNLQGTPSADSILWTWNAGT